MKNNALSNWLQRPLALNIERGPILRMATIAGAVVAAFLFLFRPFGTTVEPGAELSYLGYCLGFGLVTFVTVLVWLPLAWLFPRWFEETRWVIGKEVLMNVLMIFLIGLGNMLYSYWLFGSTVSVKAFVYWQMLTFAVGLIPSMVIATLRQRHSQQQYSRQAADLSHQLEVRLETGAPVSAIQMNPVVIQGDNQGEALSVEVGQIRYIEAADNYIQVFYEENGQIRSRMLRATLKKAEETLSTYPGFFRCHRTFLVQVSHVQHISGNAQGYRLHLAGVTDPIPVSRKQNDAIAQLFGK